MPARLLILASIIVLTWLRVGPAQQRSPQPIPGGFLPDSPEKFFEFMLPKETPAEREAIERVPVSVREEQQYGNRAADTFLDDLRSRGIEVHAKGRDVDYVRQLADAIKPQMRNKGRYRSLRVFVADCNESDAMAFPGGTVFVCRGLLDFCRSEAALVGVLGHELSHLDHGHQMQLVRRMKLARQSLTQRGGSVEQLIGGGMTLMKAFMRPFRPEDEAEADTDGATWAFRAGYEPREMAELFLRMAQRNHETRNVPEFFRSHPYSADRAHAVRDLYLKLQADEPAEKLYVGRQNLNKRVPRTVREFAD